MLLGEPEKIFENLKKRYSKKKIALKKLTRSGAGRDAEFVKAEEEMSKYNFLSWINPFISPTESICTISEANTQSSQDQFQVNNEDQAFNDNLGNDNVEEDDMEINMMCSEELEDTNEGSSTTRQQSSRKRSHNATSKSASKGKSSSPADDILYTINERLKERERKKLEEANEKEDSDSTFGKMVANELRSLPKRLKMMLKHEINNSIFKYQMQFEKSNNEITDGNNYHTHPNTFPSFNSTPMSQNFTVPVCSYQSIASSSLNSNWPTLPTQTQSAINLHPITNCMPSSPALSSEY